MRAFAIAAVFLFAHAFSAQAQGRRVVYSYSHGPRAAGAYGGGYAGYGYPASGLVVPGYHRAPLHTAHGVVGPGGPRVVTWYTPGLGYTANVQTGLPWHAPKGYRHPSTDDEPAAMMARQQRALRRMETVHAVNHHQLGRKYPAFLDQSLVANSKWNKKNGQATQDPPATLPAADTESTPTHHDN